jgi:glycosyltransferase involved in cell wall biosynthesis
MTSLNPSIKVSIIIPTYNRKVTLQRTIESLFNQTFPKNNYEVIVVDDGSTDGTESLVRDMVERAPVSLSYLKQKNQGPPAARNFGIDKATGEIIGFTDDDCKPEKRWIENAVSLFENREVMGVVGSTTPCTKPEVKVLKALHTMNITEDEGSYASCNIFYRKKILNELGGFDPEFKSMWEDTDLAHRVLSKGHIIKFDRNVKVCHNVAFNSAYSHLRSLRKHELTSLFYKKHPELKRKLLLGFVRNKKSVYPLFLILTIIGFVSENNLSAFAFLLISLAGYLWAYSGEDRGLLKYVRKIVLIPRAFFPDALRLIYVLKGDMKYRCFVI